MTGQTGTPAAAHAVEVGRRSWRRRRPSGGWPGAVVVVLLILTGVGDAPGQAARAHAAGNASAKTARGHFRQGEAHYAAGKYAAALASYQAGYEVQSLPGFLVNMAQCLRRMGDLGRARATYGRFVLMAPDSPLVPEVRGLIEELDRLIAETAAADTLPPSSASAPVPGPVPGPAPADAPPSPAVDLDTGPDILPLGAPETGPSSPRTAAGAELTSSATRAGPNTETNGPSQATRATSRRWWLWGSVAAVAVGAAVLAVVLSAPDANVVHEGSLGTVRR